MTHGESGTIRIEFGDVEEFERELEDNLRNGGAMAPGVADAEEGQIRGVELVRPGDGATLELEGRVVWVGERGGTRMAGLALLDFGPRLRERIDEFAAGRGEGPVSKGKAGGPRSVRDRLRGLSVAQQVKVAREGEATERMALERIYGKNVWEALLRNPRVTPPEVARIANMGALPVPLMELIVSNASWLAHPAVRRALLGHPRLGAAAVVKVLRSMPRGELGLAPRQTIYPARVREAARRLLGS